MLKSHWHYSLEIKRAASSNPALTGKFSCPSTSSSHTSPPSCDKDLEFSGGANSLTIAYLSAKGPGGTSGAHTHKLRALVSPPASS